MRHSALLLVALCSSLSGGLSAAEGEPGGPMPRTFRAAACLAAPTIDGRQSPDEWQSAMHYSVPLTMINPASAAQTAIQADVWMMNSASQLFLAVRLPDDDLQTSLQPLDIDLVALEFCRGKELADGDDKKIVAPGLYADKRFVAPGKDADDKIKHGRSAMGYSGAGAEGAHFVELALPLDSGDGEDVATGPGQSVAFNLVFIDGFRAEPGQTRIGGLYGPSLDSAATWGQLALADTQAEAAPPPNPAWLEGLFPHTGEPEPFGQRFGRTEITTLDVGGKPGGKVTCRFIYPEIDGKVETGTVIFFLPPELAAGAGTRVPLLHVAGYEIDANGVMPYLKDGIAVSTVHGHPLNPLARGPKLEWALLHAERRLPFVDDAKVLIQGGSAGGYMTLMTAGETFPLVCAMPAVPPVNWAYNATYIARSKAMAFSNRPGTEAPWLPVVGAVTGIVEQAQPRFGTDTEDAIYFELSPVRLPGDITAPVLTVFSTADLLVPVDQVGAEFVRPFAGGDFPEGFTPDMASVLEHPDRRVRLLDVLDPDSREVFVESVPEGTGRLKADGGIDGVGKNVALPFSRTRRWSIVILDEGSPEPHVGHFKYAVNPDFTAFRQWALGEGIRPDQLTLGKLERMMKRYLGVQPFDVTVTPATGEPHRAQMLDFPQAERADVLRGLTTFARDDAAARRLAEAYADLPGELKAFGEPLGDGSAAAVRRALETIAADAAN